ncbi:MAG: hypothetical protein Q4G64_07070, partial [bacterium]|nr:hypothetical protein [bacterium]
HPVPAYTLEKSSDPVSGSVVEPGVSITYTLTVVNTSDAVLTGRVVTDDLSGVLAHASLVGEPAEGLSLDGEVLTWAVPTLEAGASASVSYTVLVNDDARGVTLRNVATPGEDDGGECEGTCSTEHPVPLFTLAKSVDADGDGVFDDNGDTVMPGDTLSYQLTVTNTSEAVVSGALVTDNLAGVLAHATLGELPTGATVSGTTLTWAVPELGVGESVTITYRVTVKDDAWSSVLTNVVTPSGGGVCAPDECTTENPVPGYSLVKSSDPASGTAVKSGDTVTYTLTVTNTSEAVVSGAVVNDDLADVLDNATLTEPLAAGLTLAGSALTWTVPELAVGATVSVSYTVTVNAGQVGQSLVNVATPSDGGVCPPDECTTMHPIPSFTLTKVSDPVTGSTVRPGDEVTYTLTVRNTGSAALVGAVVTDHGADMFDDATLVGPLPAGVTRDGSTLTWAVPEVPVGGSVSVSYTVKVDADAWEVTLLNVATPSEGGVCETDCAPELTTPKLPSSNGGPPPPAPKPPTPPAPPVPPKPLLPPTGADSLPLAVGAAGMVLMGLTFVRFSNRRARS